MKDEDRRLKRENGELYYNTVHTLMMLVTQKGFKQFFESKMSLATINYVNRPYDFYDTTTEEVKKRNFVKMEIFFLFFYDLIKEQGFLEIKREEVC